MERQTVKKLISTHPDLLEMQKKKKRKKEKKDTSAKINACYIEIRTCSKV